MSVCNNTGLSIPECSCAPCLRAQLAQHMPALLESRERPTQPGPQVSPGSHSPHGRHAA